MAGRHGHEAPDPPARLTLGPTGALDPSADQAIPDRRHGTDAGLDDRSQSVIMLPPSRRDCADIRSNGPSGRNATDRSYVVEPSDRTLDEGGGDVELSETTIGVLIGAGATVGGSLVTWLLACLVGSRRRRWEDGRRWDRARRLACANFLGAARNAYMTADDMLETLIQHKEFGQRFKAAEAQFEAAKKGRGKPPNIAELRADRRAITTRVESLDSRVDESSNQLGEAATEIHVIAPRRVQDAAYAQVEVLTEVLGSPRSERDSWTTDQLRAMREEVRKRWWETSEDLQQAVAEELRVESRRALPRHRPR